MVYINEIGHPWGFLYRVSDSAKKQCTRNKVVLKISERQMDFYQTDGDTIFKTIYLKFASMVDAVPDNKEEKLENVFYITVCGEDEYFKAEDGIDRDYWVNIVKGLLLILPRERSNTLLVQPMLKDMEYLNHDVVAVRNSLPVAMNYKGPPNVSMNYKGPPNVNQPDSYTVDTPNLPIKQHYACDRATSKKEGFCYKIDKRKNWKKKYFVLDYRGISYMIAKNDEASRHIKITEITDCEEVSGGYSNRKYVFKVNTLRRRFYIDADSATHMKEWIQLINTVMISAKNIACLKSALKAHRTA